MPVFDSSGNLKVVGDRAGNIAIYNPSGTLVSENAQFLQFSGSAVAGVTAISSGVLINLQGGSGSASSGSASSTFTKGILYNYPINARNTIVWRADEAHVLSNIRGLISGSTGATASFQAAKNGSSLHLSATMNIPSNNLWFVGGTVANGSYATGDYLEIRLISVSGTVVHATIQADFSS